MDMDTSPTLNHGSVGSGEDAESVIKQHSSAHNSLPATMEPDGGFDCNICLEFAQEPVVTFCGHLYCWPCIYKWLNLHSSSQPCPVCKSTISVSSLIPLYGRGKTVVNPGMDDSKIPNRPSAHWLYGIPQTLSTSDENHRHHRHDNHGGGDRHHHQHHIYTDGPYVSSMDVMSRFMQPTIAGIAMSVFHSLVGNSDVGFHYSNDNTSNGNYSSSHGFYFTGGGSGGPRMRQREQQVAKGLDKLLFFISCFAVLCLLFF